MQSIAAPPEISSALVNTGPGATSLLDAAGAWRLLGAQLDEQADGYVSALSALVDSWRGRSAAAMVASAEPYLLWLRTTAQECRRTAASIRLAAAAFDSVRAAVTPPAAITANRARRVELLATNRFGTNSAAIAENESQYLAMWTTNTAAMTRYQAASAQATTLSGFDAPTTTPSAGNTSLDGLLTSLEALVNPYDPNYGWSGLANTYANQFVSSGFPINLLSYLAQNTSAQALQNVNAAIGQGLSEGEAALAPALPLGGLGALGAAGLTEMPTAAIGVGMKVGPLTAPPAAAGLLATAQAPVQLASAVTPLPAPESAGFSGVPPILPPIVPPAAAAGSGWRKRRQQKYEDLEVGLELRGPVMPKPPSAG
ncbi:hypothetical protein BST33_14840 [Mycolicibacter minnesotensis]|uniref:Uncharacterized protein n=1 Tax=Mycolicibacter minnesotensis TaxID=1118379 RepID=A0A7I7R7G4_9MYCO|nr:PPE family protein [Mycolicibacter minnesotensis]ORA99220.1 hypothetical protein BST33_14840 [Mycolicibacter minnesotensis]BBY34613.1 hypothetical protein MMIN_26740 [Mycolicibacter minnesotensis]